MLRGTRSSVFISTLRLLYNKDSAPSLLSNVRLTEPLRQVQVDFPDNHVGVVNVETWEVGYKAEEHKV